MAGSHGCGKSTLYDAARNSPSFGGFVFSGSESRLLANRLEINQAATVPNQMTMMVSMLAKEVALGKHKDVFTERTPLDFLAYTYYQNKHVFNGEFDKHLKIMEDSVKVAMGSYNTICYFPAYWPIEDDGVRPLDPQYQKDIAMYITMFMERFGIRPIIMQNEPVDKRLYHLVEWLKRRL